MQKVIGAERQVFYSNLCDDIEVSRKTCENLVKSVGVLRAKVELQRFELDEAQVNDSGDFDEEEEEENREDFFSFLSAMEREETDMKIEIEEFGKQIAELGRNIALFKTKNAKIKENIRHLEEDNQIVNDSLSTYESERERIKDEEYHQMEENYFLQQKIEQINNERDEIIARVKNHMDDLIEEMKRKKGELIEKKTELLESIRISREKLRNDKKRLIQNSQTNEKVLQTKNSVSTWLGDRAINIDKIRRIRAEIAKLETEYENTENKRRKVSVELQTLFGDPSGVSTLAYQMVHAEIESYDFIEPDETATELEVEKEYGESLEKEINMLTESLSVFKKHKDNILSDLNIELDEAMSKGYLDMLERDVSKYNQMLLKKNGI